jgi:hypothetical protein
MNLLNHSITQNLFLCQPIFRFFFHFYKKIFFPKNRIPFHSIFIAFRKIIFSYKKIVYPFIIIVIYIYIFIYKFFLGGILFIKTIKIKYKMIGLPGARTRNSSDESRFISLFSIKKGTSSQTVLAIFIAHGFLYVSISYL